MIQNKGEAAFESVDEVLAEKIVENTKDHGETKAPAEKAAVEKDATQIGDGDGRSTPQSRPDNRWILVAVITVILLIAGCVFFGKCTTRFKKYWR